jgi:hypothetical protein
MPPVPSDLDDWSRSSSSEPLQLVVDLADPDIEFRSQMSGLELAAVDDQPEDLFQSLGTVGSSPATAPAARWSARSELQAGDLFRVKLDVNGLVESAFKG